jgi:phosphoglucosamine mutase
VGKQLFGTDGIRGVAGKYPLDPETVYAFGVALGEDAAAASKSPEVLIGMDTRESGTWFAQTVAGGLASRCVCASFAGVITTPGVAHLTSAGPYVAGVMISASHNPFEDNGIKVFGHSGFKLPDSEEHLIERRILELRETGVVPQPAPLKADETLDRRYLDYLAGIATTRLDGVKIAVDCGNGAASPLGPELFRKLGAEVTVINCEPNGRNINLHCGALHVEALCHAVRERGADFGVAFDGDADRAIFSDRRGRVVNGDAVLLACGRALQAQGRLPGNIVVSTVMANLGLERAFEAAGIKMVRTPVGDKYVLEEMVRLGATLGGEQSGHVIFREYSTTGDGILTALRLFEIAHKAGMGLDELTGDLQVFPQKLVNVRVRQRKSLEHAHSVTEEIRKVEEAFAGSGRVLVRFSGTEPLARVMVEGTDQELVDRYSASIAEAIRREMGE